MAQARSFFRPLDAMVIAVVGAASCWGLLAFKIADGAKAIVYVDNKKFAWYDLAGDKREVTLASRIGPVRIEVGGGSARILSSPCPNKLCVKTGPVSHAHEEIICVPAQVILTIEGTDGGKAEGNVDAITF